MDRQIIKIIDELVEVSMKTCCETFRLHVNDESMKIARTICDANPRAENKRHALRGHHTGELK
jgi:hypothetical protein